LIVEHVFGIIILVQDELLLLTLDVSNEVRYYMIKSINCKETNLIWQGYTSKKLPTDIQHIIRRKLYMLDAAILLSDLRVPPGNRLEKLSGDLEGYHSIRINDQFRIIFTFESGDAYNVKVTDYH